MKETSTRGIVLSSFWYLIFLFLYGSGIVHSYKRHSKIDFVISFFPPWGLFRGAEQFWHKTPKINWDERLKQDAEIILKLLTAMPKSTEEQREVDKAIVGFSERIGDYTPARISYLKDASNMYLRLHSAIGIDMRNFIKDVINGNNSLASNWAVTCKPIMDSMAILYSVEGLDDEYKEMEDNLRTIKSGMQDNPPTLEEAEMMIDGFKKVDSTDKLRIRKVYKTVFNEAALN